MFEDKFFFAYFSQDLELTRMYLYDILRLLINKFFGKDKEVFNNFLVNISFHSTVGNYY